MKRRFLYIFLLIFITGFFVLPGNASADVQLSQYEVQNLLGSIKSGLFSAERYNLLSTSGVSEPAKQAVLILLDNAITAGQINYAFLEIPKNNLKILVEKIAFFLALPAGDEAIVRIFEEIDKEMLRKANEIVKEWASQKELRVATGLLNKFSYNSYKGNLQKPVFGYSIILKPVKDKTYDGLVEIYSPEPLEPIYTSWSKDGRGPYWGLDEWQQSGAEKLDPFITRVKGKISEEFGGGYTWQDASVDILFNEPIPEFDFTEPTLSEKIINRFKSEIDKAKDNIGGILEGIKYFSDGAIDLTKNTTEYILGKIKSLFSDLNPFKSAIAPLLTSLGDSGLDLSHINIENLFPKEQPTPSPTPSPQPSISLSPQPQLTLDDIQDQLDDIAEQVDILAQQVVEIIRNAKAGIGEEKPKEIAQTTEEEEDQEPEEDAEPQKITKKPSTKPPATLSGSSSPSYPKILINEIQIAGSSDEKEEFVELYNPNKTDVDLTGWYLQKKTKTAADFSSFASSALFSGKTIRAKGYFLIARQDSIFASSADITTKNSLTKDNTLAIKNPNREIADKVGWGQAQDFETAPAENPQVGKSIAREWGTQEKNYIDSDNNLFDFKGQSPTPGTKNGVQPGPEPEPEPLTVLISEIQVADNEFVEIYNFGEKEIAISDWHLSYFSSSKQIWNDPSRNWQFPEGKVILPKQHFLVGIYNFPESGGNPNSDWEVKTTTGNPYSTGQLSNSGGAVVIFPWDPEDKTAEEAEQGRLDAVGWGNAMIKEGEAVEEPGNGESLSRKKEPGTNQYQDTNNNQADFGAGELSPTNSKGEIFALPSLADFPWPMARHDAQKTGQSQYTGPQTDHLSWGIEGVRGDLIIGKDNKIYVGSSGGLYQIDLERKTAELKYNQSSISKILIGPDGAVYGHSGSGDFLAINPDSGELKWKFIPAVVNAALHFVIDQRNKLYMVTYCDLSEISQGLHYCVIAFNPQGSIFWVYDIDAGATYKNPDFSVNPNGKLSFATEGSISSPVLGFDGAIYFVAGYNNLFALNSDGTEKWKKNFSGPVESLVVSSQGNVYASVFTRESCGNFACFWYSHFYEISPAGEDPMDIGEIVGRPQILAISSDGVLYTIERRDTFYGYLLYFLGAFNTRAQPKNWLWRGFSLPGFPNAPIIGADGTFYLSPDGWRIIAFNPDGSKKWQRSSTTPLSLQAIGTDGSLYVISQEKLLVLNSLGNQGPVADAGGPYQAVKGTTITFDASVSSDPDGNSLQYRWDFDNDGNWDTPYSTEPLADFQWNEVYSGTVKLAVYDGEFVAVSETFVTINDDIIEDAVVAEDENILSVDEQKIEENEEAAEVPEESVIPEPTEDTEPPQIAEDTENTENTENIKPVGPVESAEITEPVGAVENSGETVPEAIEGPQDNSNNENNESSESSKSSESNENSEAAETPPS